MWWKAKFEWLNKQPLGISYFANTWIDSNGWTVCLDLLENRLMFAATEAPSYKLVAGFVLELFNGPKKVGTATIEEESFDDGIEVPKAGTRAVDDMKRISDENCMDVPKAVVRKLEDDIKS